MVSLRSKILSYVRRLREHGPDFICIFYRGINIDRYKYKRQIQWQLSMHLFLYKHIADIVRKKS